MRQTDWSGHPLGCRLEERQMFNSGKVFGSAVMIAAMAFAFSSCQKKEGPVEQAGKKVDQAAEKVGQEIEKAGSKIQDAAQGDKK
jgi:hypothetical protein